MNLKQRDFEVLQMESPNLPTKDLESQHLIANKSRFTWFYDKQKTDNLRNFGRTWAFCFYNSEPLITIGPHWYLFSIMWFIGFLMQEFMTMFVLNEFSNFSRFLTKIVGFTALGAYCVTSVKNPGIYKRNMMVIDSQSNKNFCVSCNVIATKDMLHCEDCDVCVMGFDHHCPWTGKCIGKGNVNFFYLFILATFGYFFLIIGEVIWYYHKH